MSNIPLGEPPAKDARRDAVHVAIAPGVARENVYPGQRVSLIESPNLFGIGQSEAVGIVDPYLIGVVFPGQPFWVCLFPNTVTGMRHHWAHPAFDSLPSGPAAKVVAERWLRDFVSHADCPDFDTVISAASGKRIESPDPDCYGTHTIDDEYLHFSGCEAHGDIPAEFWEHLETYVGHPITVRPPHFSCGC